ncbi:MAG: hypothetical protein Q9218_003210 [Villophora microphyllina]
MVNGHSRAYRARRKATLHDLVKQIHERQGVQQQPLNSDQRNALNHLYPDHWDKAGNRLMEANAHFAPIAPRSWQTTPSESPPAPLGADTASIPPPAPIPPAAAESAPTSIPPPAAESSPTSIPAPATESPPAPSGAEETQNEVDDGECPICTEEMSTNEGPRAALHCVRCSRFLDDRGDSENGVLEADMLQKANREHNLDDFRKGFQIYSRATLNTTYVELEQAFRINSFNVHLIATKKELPVTYTHSARACPKEATENPDKVEVKFVNYNKLGHRARDCTQASKDKYVYRNYKQSGHNAAEYTEPRSAEGVEYRKYNKVGHFSKDYPTSTSSACRNRGEEGHISKERDKPRNPATITCRNPKQMGYLSKEYPLPRDYNKVTCSNCGETGHTKVRYKQPPKEVDIGYGDNAGRSDSAPITAEGGNKWGNAAVEPIAVGGGCG